MNEPRIWLLLAKKMSDEATEEESSELEAIFKANPDLQYAFSIVDEIKGPSAQDYGLTEEEEHHLLQERLVGIDTILQAQEKRIKANRSAVRVRKFLWAAACLLLLLAFSIAYFFYDKGDQSRHMAQVTGKAGGVFVADTPTSITLQDGTQVWLNSASTLKCAPDFGKKDRQVILSGEAYFDVKQQADKPFIVRAGSFMNVKVLGTTFNVKAYPQDPYMEASLISGKIAVKMENDEKAPVILKPREKITFYITDTSLSRSEADKHAEAPSNYHISAITPNPVDQHISELSWMRGELAFNDVPFMELAYDLERIYHVNISFKQEQLKDYHLTGVFKGESLNQVLQALQVTTPFHYNISNKEVSIYR